MTMTAAASRQAEPDHAVRAQASGRDASIDTMRGIAILMVIGIHSLQQPLDVPWATLVDALLRPCVPIFLFASGFLTARSGRVSVGKRINAALIPYAIAFVAAYIYMALHNPAMDQRIATTVARFVLAYVFVYYYVFVYIGCTAMLWLTFRAAAVETHDQPQRLVLLLMLAIAAGLTIGSYLDPLLLQFGISPSIVQEVRLRDIPFWFCFAALGALVGTTNAMGLLHSLRGLVVGATVAFYAIYAAARILGIGDDADYDSMAFFGYAASFCLALLACQPRMAVLAAIGSGSYFIYLWHIFIIMALRDHTSLRALGPAADSIITYVVTAVVSVAALMTVRQIAPPRLSRWMGA